MTVDWIYHKVTYEIW